MCVLHLNDAVWILHELRFVDLDVYSELQELWCAILGLNQ